MLMQTKQLMQTKIYVTKIKLVKPPKFPDSSHSCTNTRAGAMERGGKHANERW